MARPIRTRDELLADAALRLQRVCAGMPDDAFAALVVHVVDTKLKFDAMESADARERDDASRRWLLDRRILEGDVPKP